MLPDLGYTFRNSELLTRALTLKGANPSCNNEELECLGDSLIGFVAAEKFYAMGLNEGGITSRKKAVVCDRALYDVSVALGLDKALIRPKGGEGNKKAVPSAYEAVAAAIYLDGGMQAARAFILRTLDFSRSESDYIALLQEALQARHMPLPVYSRGVDSGNDAEHNFCVSITANGRTFEGHGFNIAEARRNAAHRAYSALFDEATK